MVKLMKRRRLILISAAVAVALGALLALAFRPGEKEPEYQGKKLSEWIGLFSNSPTEAGRAVRSIGTDAIPFLLQWIKEARRQEIARNFPSWALKSRAVSKWGHLDSCRAGLGEKGFRILGPSALPALPRLTQLLRESKSGTSARWAADSLTYLGKDGLLPLLEILQDRNQADDKRAAVASAFWNIGYLGSNAVAAVPVLVACAAETNYDLSHEAAAALLYLFEEETPSIKSLDTSDWAYRMPSPDAVLRRVVFANAVRYRTNTNPHWAPIVLIQALEGYDPSLRTEASKILGLPPPTGMR
jgi:hypothetical protein